MASVTYEHVYKRFGDVVAVNDLNIQIAGQGIPGSGGPIGLRQNHRAALSGRAGRYQRGTAS